MIQNIENIASILGLPKPHYHRNIDTLLTDSRSLETPESTLFFAIPTDGNDGHRYIRNLYERGVHDFVVNQIPADMVSEKNINWLIVPNTIDALQKVAARNQNFLGEILAITGSRGKTTLKEWIYQLMEPLSQISRSPRSFNSQIGVPLSLWNLNPQSSLGIIEAGISRKGEMHKLAQIISPDTVIFTNLGDAHSDGFDSLYSKGMEKAQLAMTDSVKTIIFPYDSKKIREILQNQCSSRKLLSWSLYDNNATVKIHTAPAQQGGMNIEYTFEGESHSLYAPLSTPKDIENFGNSLTFMLHSGVDHNTIRERFKNLHKIGTRLNVSEGVNGCSVILDSYTSDFSSLRPALDFMRRRQMPHQSATLILADLHHEADSPEKECREIAKLLRHAGISRFIGIGTNLQKYASYFPTNSDFFTSTTEFLNALSASEFSDEIILLKGSPEHSLLPIAELLETRKHETVLEVNLDAIVENYNYFRSQLPSESGLICMVKAFGYGAGSYEIAKTLQDCGASYLAVAVLDEGIELRRQGITMPIMVMNPKVMNYRSMFANGLEPEIYSLSMLTDVINEARKIGAKDYPVHLKLDTGMHRMGFVENEIPQILEILKSQTQVKVSTIFSHLATADCIEMDDYTLEQLHCFERGTSKILAEIGYPVKRHILNSAGILRFPEYHYDYARLGIGLYGANTLPETIEKPLAVVSTLRTIIIAIREYSGGETIGYGRYGKTNGLTRVATLPIGYADGMNRHFGRGAISVKINGKEAPTIGNICMDACMINVTGIDCKVGDTVEIFGKNAPLQRLAETLDTIPYEILTSISPRVKRIYYRE